MYCTSCGTENREGTNFCTHCGAPMTPVAQRAPGAFVLQTPMGPAAPAGSVAAAGSDYRNGPAALLKKLAASPVFLMAVICTTLSVILKFVFANANTIYLVDQIYDLIPQDIMTFEMEDILEAIIEGTYHVGTVSAIITNLPTILILIGLWITAASAFSKKRTTITTGGLTVIRVIMIIELVLSCLLLVFLEFVMAIYTATELKYYDVVGAGVTMIVITAMIFAFIILNFVLILRSLKAASSVAVTGKANPEASVFVAVLLIIGSVFSLIPGLLFLPAGLSDILAAMGGILFAVTIFRYRSEMQNAAWRSAQMPPIGGNQGSGYYPQGAYGYGQPDMSYGQAPVYPTVPVYPAPPTENDGAAPAAPDADCGAEDSEATV
ncbi:MAG: zinc ribbon domain-containing protein [Oscillospiraceae bacterium]|nr:zinc ribbon domain-containing protein [Oscillospiraceae bacterium]